MTRRWVQGACWIPDFLADADAPGSPRLLVRYEDLVTSTE
jgi:hypothetical protein